MGLQALKPDAKYKLLGKSGDFFVMQFLKKVNREKGNYTKQFVCCDRPSVKKLLVIDALAKM